MIGFIVICYVIGCAIGAAFIMDGKGRSSVGAMLGFFLGLLGVGAALCFTKTLEKRAEEEARVRALLAGKS